MTALPVPSPAMPSPDALVARARAVLTRPLWAGVALLSLYAVLSLFNSTGGYLGTDTGAKVITLDEMVDGSTLRPDVGYWAEEWDPKGRYHPLYQSARNDEGEWVNVTTLPMLVVAHPLYDFGGYRLALLPAMLGTVLGAFAARDIARQLGSERDGWRAFWVVGCASPLVVYGLDFWEHAIGAGLMTAAAALLLRTARSDRSNLLPAGAGALLGAAASMRTETFVVALVAVGATCITLLWRRRIGAAVMAGALAVTGFALPWTLNDALETALGGNRRSDRVEGVVDAGRSLQLGVRAKEALITWFGTPSFDYPGDVLVGAAMVGSLALAWWAHRRSEARIALLAVATAGVCLLLALSSGLGFVPGALVASPVAAAALVAPRWSPERAVLVAAVLAATFLTWLYQYTGGAGPQWGGRYLLAPTTVLAAAGAVLLGSAPALVRRSFVAGAVVVTAFGVLWLQERSGEIDRLFDQLAVRSEDVVISTNGFLVREGGPATQERRYLSLDATSSVQDAVDDVVRPAGFDTFGVLGGDAPDLDGARRTDTIDIEVLGLALPYHVYEVHSAPDRAPRP